MNTAKSIAALMLVIASSSALAEGGSDRLHGKMIQANEQAMRAYAAANGKKPPEVIHYRYGMKLDVARVISMTSLKGSCDVTVWPTHPSAHRPARTRTGGKQSLARRYTH